MFVSIKNRVVSVISPDVQPSPELMSRRALYSHRMKRHLQQQYMLDKFNYRRPPFLDLLTHDELCASANHSVRPIIVPRDISLLPWGTGYAECINSGKSKWNEDQGAFCRQVLSDPTHRYPDLPYTYFGIFDGHAGYGAALAASHQFHHILHEKLVDLIDLLLPRGEENTQEEKNNGFPHPSQFHKRIVNDELITGALESSFLDMDSIIAQDRDRYRDAGGCTACVSLFINGKMFVANAGDSRAVLCQRKSPINKPIAAATEASSSTSAAATKVATEDQEAVREACFHVPFSFDHTPETERLRLLGVASLKPELLCGQYVAMEFAKRPHSRDLGQRILCRDGTMKGWTYKTLAYQDLLMPVVTGEGKRSRLLGTLGVTRGFGDHDLLAINTGVLIKPFLTPHPDVNYRDFTKIVSIPDENNKDGDYGILIMGTDGLWDVSENEAVSRTVFQTLAKYPTEKHRYTMVAQELVAKARGKIDNVGHWRLTESNAVATVDDISVFVIPVYQYYKEHVEWEKKCALEHQEKLERDAQRATEANEAQQTEAALLLNGVAITRAEIEEHAVGQEDTIVEQDEGKKELAQVVEETTSSNSDQRVNKKKKSKQATHNAQINAAVTALEATEISAHANKK